MISLVRASRGTLGWGILLWLAQSSQAQVYPSWFLDQQGTSCGPTVVGYARASFYPDSSAAQAIRDGSERWAQLRQTVVEGGQAFWSTEIGTAWMGSSIQEHFDTTSAAQALTFLAPLDTLLSAGLVAVLLGEPGCVLAPPLRQRQAIERASAPAWTERPPQESRSIYAVGVAPEYYYEMSSWNEAEQRARLNLARTVNVKVKELQKVGIVAQEIENEELSVVLRDVQVVARWRDVRGKIFYVLMRMSQ